MSFAFAMLIALALDVLIGWPDALFRRVGHPVTWIGAGIGALDRGLNREHWSGGRRRTAGALAVGIVVALTLVAAFTIQVTLPDSWTGTLILGVLAWPLVAARSLFDHVSAVAGPLARGDLAAGRSAVAMIVGRDPSELDDAGVARAAIESLAENTSDGVVAPLFWGAIAGLPGIAGYKAINTLDSMVGHRTPRHEAFGMVAARLDDAVNFLPARLTGLQFVAVCGRPWTSFHVMWRDARHHRSPNAGWPEAAMAGALGVRLSGPRVYGGRATDDPWVNAGARDPGAHDIGRGLALFVRSMVPLGALLVLAALFGG